MQTCKWRIRGGQERTKDWQKTDRRKMRDRDREQTDDGQESKRNIRDGQKQKTRTRDEQNVM